MAIPSLASPAMLAVQERATQLVKQGMPPAQIAQILQQEVLPTGQVPITQLYQLLNYVKANAAKQQQPPPDSVAVQLADQVKQIAAHKMMPQGLQGMAPQPHPAGGPGLGGLPPGPPPNPGVAGLPQQSIGGPGAYAGGGIVAFDEGGDISLSPVQQQQAQQQAAAMVARMQGRQHNPGRVVMNPVEHFDDGGDVGGTGGSVGEAYKNYLINQFGLRPAVNAYRGIAAAGQSLGNVASDIFAPRVHQPATVPAAPAGATAPATGLGGIAGLAGPSQSSALSPAMVRAANPGLNPTQASAPSPADTIKNMKLTAQAQLAAAQTAPGADLGKEEETYKAPSVDETIQQFLDAKKKFGVGAGLDVLNAKLDKEEADLAQRTDYNKKLALAQAGFAMAAQASKLGGDPGYAGRGLGGFAAAAAAGGSEWAKELIANQQRAEAANDRLLQYRYQAAAAAQQGDMQAVRDAVLAHRSDVQLQYQSVHNLAMLTAEREKVAAELQMRQMDMDKWRMMYSNKPQEVEAEIERNIWNAQKAGKTDDVNRGIAFLTSLRGTGAGPQAADIRAAVAEQAIREKALNSTSGFLAVQALQKARASGDQKAIDAAQQNVNDIVNQYRGQNAGITPGSPYDASSLFGRANAIISGGQ